jgi:hypothetical protein
MEVRIEPLVKGSMTVVTIAGRLAASCVPELHKLCRSVEGALALNLSDLVSADDEGLKALRELEEWGAELRGVSPFIRLLLASDPTGDLPVRDP